MVFALFVILVKKNEVSLGYYNDQDIERKL